MKLLSAAVLVLALVACSTSAPPEAGSNGPQVEPQGGTISYDDGTKRIYSFLVSRGRLKVNYWDGRTWRWADQQLPRNTTGMTDFDLQGRPSVITYSDGNGRQNIHVFVRGRDRHLYMNHWDGARWSWSHYGTPTVTTNLGYNDPEAVTYEDPSGQRRIDVFVKGSDNRLHVGSWNGGGWGWESHGLPPGASGIHPRLRATTYWDPDIDRQRVHVFVAAGGRLYDHSWDGNGWRWDALGRPGGADVANVLAATSFRYQLRNRVYTTVQGRDGRVYAHERIDATTTWHATGTQTVDGWAGADAVAYLRAPRNYAQVETFLRGTDGRLYILRYDDARGSGAKWVWEDRGTPTGTRPYTIHGATTYLGPHRRVYAFLLGEDGSYHVNYTLDAAATGRHWQAQGRP